MAKSGGVSFFLRGERCCRSEMGFPMPSDLRSRRRLICYYRRSKPKWVSAVDAEKQRRLHLRCRQIKLLLSFNLGPMEVLLIGSMPPLLHFFLDAGDDVATTRTDAATVRLASISPLRKSSTHRAAHKKRYSSEAAGYELGRLGLPESASFFSRMLCQRHLLINYPRSRPSCFFLTASLTTLHPSFFL
ncbi:hypothetical protein ACLOJK_001835 [Asimina triloba]